MAHGKSPWRVALLLVIVCAAVAATCVPAAAVTGGASTGSTSNPLLPNSDSFYRYTGTRPLAQIAPGTVLATRAVTLADASAGSHAAEQIEYRTTDERDQPVVSVTTVLAPAKADVAAHVVAYLSFYDALGAQCDPSYTLRGGNPGSADTQTASLERAVVSSLAAQGDVVTVPDFEDPALDFLAGQEAGHSALDSIRATESYLHLAADTDVGMIGYSGGSVAAEWASELAPRYAPALHLVGVAEGGIPVDPAHNLAYINGGTQWAGVIPAALVGISRAFGISLAPYLTTYGREVTAAVSHDCLGAFTGNYPKLTLASLVLPQYRDLITLPIFAGPLNKLVMGTSGVVPAEPLLIVVGKSDATGDGVMVTADVAGLAARYCTAHVSVDLDVLNGLNHAAAAVAFLPLAFSFLTARFDAGTVTDTCAPSSPSSPSSNSSIVSTGGSTPLPSGSQSNAVGSMQASHIGDTGKIIVPGLAGAAIVAVGGSWLATRRRRRH